MKLYLFLLFALGVSAKDPTYPVAQIKTNKGEILFWLYNQTPEHKKSFIKLTEAGYFDTLSFNRVIKDFVIQGGCPDTPAGFADSPYLLQPEFKSNLKHVYGAVGGGRDGNAEKLTAGCQFYIVHQKNGITRLDNNYVIYGQVFKGFEVLEAIATTKTDSTDTPIEKVTIDVNIIQMSIAALKKHGFKGSVTE